MMANDVPMTTAEVLAEKRTSQCIEYRRAWRREYRRNLRRIDYMPTRNACEIIDAAIRCGVALSQADAIEQALANWQEPD
jgi:hypothetical protein